MPVYTLDPLRDPRWPAFLERRPDASIFHTREWLDCLRRTYAYEPVAYTTSPPDAELTNALAFCRVESWLTGRRLVSLPFSDHSEPLADDAALDEILGFLERRRDAEQWKYIELRPRRTVDAPGFAEAATFVFHRLDLRPSLHAVYGGFHRDCVQRKIRRAEREGLSCEAGRSERLLRDFYALVVMTCRRKRLPPQPLAWFRNLIRTLGDRLTLHVASKAARPVAGILTVGLRHTLVYKYACSDPRAHPLGGVQLLLWTVIQEAKRGGFVELDLGRSDPDQPGLIAFKDRWGASRSVGSYLRCSGAAAARRSSLRYARSVFARLPDRLLVAAGKLLYRHAG